MAQTPRTSGVFSLGALSADNAFEAPSLDLNFDGTASSYTRATTSPTAAKANGDQLATDIVTQNKGGTVQSKYMGPNGKLINGYVTNLVEYSDFTNAAWTAGSAYTVSTASGAGPFGGDAAQIDVAATGDAWLYDDVSATGLVGQTMTYSLFAKSTNSTLTLKLQMIGAASTPAAQLQVNPSTGGSALDTSTNITLSDYGARDIGNGWHRYWMSFEVPSSTTALRPNIVAVQGTTYAYGAQLETTATPSQYVPVGINLVPNSIDLRQSAGWNQRLPTGSAQLPAVTAGQSDPFGGTNASILKDDANNAFAHIDHEHTFASSQDYWCSSIFVKKNSGTGGATCVLRVITGPTSGGTYHDLHLDPNTGNTASSATANGSIVSVQDLGSWYRMSIAGQHTSSHTQAYFQFFPDAGVTPPAYPSYDSGGLGSVIVFGPQLERGSSASAYSPTGNSFQVPRVEYDSSGNALGLLVEEARTNYVLRSQALDNSVWVTPTISTVDANVHNAPDGTATADRVNVNTAGYIYQTASGLTQNTEYTASWFIKADSATAFVYGFYNQTGGAWITRTEYDPTTGEDFGNGWYRFSVNVTTPIGCTSIRVYPLRHDTGGASNAVTGADGSSYVWGLQIEAGAGPTSYIPTSGASATRTADDITLSTSSFGYNTAAGTTLADFTMQEANDAFPIVYRFSDGTSSNRDLVYLDGPSGDLYAASSEGAQHSYWSIESSPSFPINRTIAFRHAGTSAQTAIDGTLGTAQTLTAAPATLRTTLQLGLQTGNHMTGHIRRFTYWPRAINDASLASYTGTNPPTIDLVRPTRRWGGITGRSLVESGNVPTTGVLSLPELLQARYGAAAAWDGSGAEILLVAGGGGGGGVVTASPNIGGGGGGAGAYYPLSNQTFALSTSYTFTVGAGGAGNTGAGQGSNGGATTLVGGSFNLSSPGGGGGGAFGSAASNGANGGSGGGAGWNSTGGSSTAGAGQFGNAGGSTSGLSKAGGGGGAGSAGAISGSNYDGADGGSGKTWAIDGVALAGGGGAGGWNGQGTGYIGQGQDGGANGSGGTATANTGGGGGGGRRAATEAGTDGASGVIKVWVPQAGYSGYTAGTPANVTASAVSYSGTAGTLLTVTGTTTITFS